MAVLKELIFNSFYLQGRVWWSVKELIFKFPLWMGVVVLKDLIFNQFLPWRRAVVVLKELIFKS